MPGGCHPGAMRPFVDLDWVLAQGQGVVLADVRWYTDGRSGRRAYEEGHLPGAVFVDLDRWLSGEGSPQAGRHPLPAPEVFAEGMGALGIGDDDRVVAYDDGGGVIAARLVWMLRVTGHEAALLDGGLLAYDGELERTPAQRPPAVFTPRPWPPERLPGNHHAHPPAPRRPPPPRPTSSAPPATATATGGTSSRSTRAPATSRGPAASRRARTSTSTDGC